MLFGCVCSIISGICQPYMMIIFGEVTGVIVQYASVAQPNATDVARLNEGVVEFAIGCTILGAITIVTTHISSIFFAYSALRQIFQFRRSFLQSTLNQDIAWYDEHKTGDFATVFTENLVKIEDGIGEKIGICLYLSSSFVYGIVLALIMGWQLALVCMISLPLSTAVMAVISWLSTRFTREELQAYAEAGAVAEEALTAIRTVVAFGGEHKELGRYTTHLVSARHNNIRKALFTSLSNGVLWFFVYACYALSFWYGVDLIIAERNGPGDDVTYTPAKMVTVFFCTLVASWNFSQLTPFFETFGAAKAAATRIFAVLDSVPVINSCTTASSPGGQRAQYRQTLVMSNEYYNTVQGRITFEDVHFNYPSRQDVKILQGITLNIEAGETVALVGRSGCGKSTCLQLLQRFYDPNRGKVCVDGNDIKSLDLRWWRSKIGVVGQEPALFATTIAENIRYGQLDASMEQIEVAAKRAKAHDFIGALPNGYATVIGERGAQLSGGQKQRIAIARALVRKPNILLLDEATSALDTTSEAEVQAALDSISGECTTIIVAHRLSTIRNASRIVVIDDGRIIDTGTHEELMGKRADYYNLVIAQCGSNDAPTSHDSKEALLSKNGLSETRISILDQPNQSNNHTESGEFEKSDTRNLSEKTSHQSTILAILRMNSPEWYLILLGCLMSIINGAALPVYGVVFGDVVGVLATSDDQYLKSRTNLYSLYFILIGVVSGVATFIQIYSFSIIGERLTFRVRQKMFSTMLSQEIGWFDRKENSVGSLCAQLSGEATHVQGASGIQIGTLLNALSTFIIANAVSLYYDWKLSLVLMSFAPFILISIYFEQRFMQSDSAENQTLLEESAKIAVESVGNIRTVAALGCEHIFLEEYTAKLQPYQKRVLRRSHLRGITLGLARSIMMFAYSMGMLYGAKLIVDELLDFSAVFKVNEIVIAGSWSIGNAFSFSPNLQRALLAASRIFQMLRRRPQILDGPVTNLTHLGSIHYDKVEFRYPTRPTVCILNGCDLTMPTGKTIALVGASGCGKSTVVQLLLRYYDPTIGRITVADHQMSTQDVALDGLRRHIGVVSQEPILFDRTIEENIAYGSVNADKTAEIGTIQTAARQANIHDFIVALPMGYATRLGATRGSHLSGGQKQRIAIARALLRQPEVLVLDEATSALDADSERTVQIALDAARLNRTCVTIAHRLATVQNADMICVLNERGVVSEWGTHAQLMATRGLYHRFYKQQNAGDE